MHRPTAACLSHSACIRHTAVYADMLQSKVWHRLHAHLYSHRLCEAGVHAIQCSVVCLISFPHFLLTASYLQAFASRQWQWNTQIMFHTLQFWFYTNENIGPYKYNTKMVIFCWQYPTLSIGTCSSFIYTQSTVHANCKYSSINALMSMHTFLHLHFSYPNLNWIKNALQSSVFRYYFTRFSLLL